MVSSTLDIAKLAGLYNSSTAVRSTIDWLSAREREPRNSETKVSNLKIDLAQRGGRFSSDDLRLALEQLSGAGCGDYKPGRPLDNSRLVWACSAKSVAAEVLSAVRNNSTTSNLSPEIEPGTEAHYFPVRPGVVLPIVIRNDMNSDELENMADFVRILARSRGLQQKVGE